MQTDFVFIVTDMNIKKATENWSKWWVCMKGFPLDKMKFIILYHLSLKAILNHLKYFSGSLYWSGCCVNVLIFCLWGMSGTFIPFQCYFSIVIIWNNFGLWAAHCVIKMMIQINSKYISWLSCSWRLVTVCDSRLLLISVSRH